MKDEGTRQREQMINENNIHTPRETKERTGRKLPTKSNYYHSLVFGELVKDRKGLIHLARHRVRELKEVKELPVVHLQQHASDLASKLRMGSDESNEPVK
jgi:hypothetical protein